MTRKLLLIGWILFVFYLSGTSAIKVTDPATWLNATIYAPHMSLMNLFDKESPFYWGYLYENKPLSSLTMEFYLRKLGHIILYSFLSFIIWSNIQKHRHAFKIAWIMTVIVAVVDECNQFLMIGRSGRLLDVVLDSVAALFVLILFYLKKK